MNFLDTLMIFWRCQVRPPPPCTPGMEGAGAVVEAGAGSRFYAGGRISALVNHGGYAEHVRVGPVGAELIRR